MNTSKNIVGFLTLGVWVFTAVIHAQVVPPPTDPIETVEITDANWSTLGVRPGANGPIYASALDDQGNLYIGGSFTEVGSVLATNVARWDGQKWSSVGFGTGDSVLSLAVTDSKLWVGGRFETVVNPDGRVLKAHHVACWNGGSWLSLNGGPDGPVLDLAIKGSVVYAGGTFFDVLDREGRATEVNGVAKWDGQGWSALGRGLDYSVRALAASDDGLYAGGEFTSVTNLDGSVFTANAVAHWDGKRWKPLGQGLALSLPSSRGPQVMDLAISGGALHVGGLFDVAANADGSALRARDIATWKDNRWSTLGAGAPFGVKTMAVSGSNLYVGGRGTGRVVRWTGSTWVGLGDDLGFGVNTLAARGIRLYAGGSSMFGLVSTFPITRWNGLSWSTTESAPDKQQSRVMDPVTTLAVTPEAVYAAGGDTASANLSLTRVTRWDARGWTTLGSDLFGIVSSLAVAGDDVYAGGLLGPAGNHSLSPNIVRWDGNNWQPLGLGVNARVSAMLKAGNDLIVGGWMSAALSKDGSSINANGIVRWDGTNWHPLGSGLSGTFPGPVVHALSEFDGGLLVGGKFSRAGGIDANSLARWDGTNWHSMAFPSVVLSGAVRAIATDSNRVFVGGYFDSDTENNSVYSWDGLKWTPLGLGGWAVHALAVAHGSLFAAGGLTTAEGKPINGVARWDGQQWHALGSGVNNTARALAVYGSDLFVGGDFNIAGGRTSFHVARLYPFSIPTLSVKPTGQGIEVSWTSTRPDDFQVESIDSLAGFVPWWAVTTPVTSDGTSRTVVVPLDSTKRFFRLHRP